MYQKHDGSCELLMCGPDLGVRAGTADFLLGLVNCCAAWLLYICCVAVTAEWPPPHDARVKSCVGVVVILKGGCSVDLITRQAVFAGFGEAGLDQNGGR